MRRKKAEKQPDDQVTLQLRAAARKKRPWTWRGILIAAAVILVPIGLFVWTIWPTPEPPALSVMAFDVLALPKEKVKLRAVLEPSTPQTRRVDLKDYELSFETGNLAKTTSLGQVKTDANGGASLSWQPPAGAAVTRLTVRYPGDKTRRASASGGRIFTLEADSALLVVEVAALSPESVENWRKKKVLDIAATAGAGPALTAARLQKYQVVYLASDADSGELYGKMRGWVERQWGAADAFPPGPVLAPAPGSTIAEMIAALKTRFRGPLAVVAGRGETADALREAGVRIFRLGGNAVAPPIIRLASWAALPQQLEAGPPA